MLRWFEQRQVYIPSRNIEVELSQISAKGEDLYLDTGDGVQINAWYIPTSTTNTAFASYALIQCHGNAGNISHRLEHYEMFQRLGINVMAFDYRGYGRSKGRPSEEGTYKDAQAAYQWLRKKGFTPDKIIILGESLGGGIASELACREKASGLILQSTFTSVPDLGAELFPFLPVRWLSTIRYATLSKLPLLKIPVMIMHSPQDTLIRYHHGKKLFESANEPKIFWDLKGDHNYTITETGDRYLEGLRKFIASIQSSPNK